MRPSAASPLNAMATPLDQNGPSAAASGVIAGLTRSALSPTEAQVRGIVLLFPITLFSLGPHFALWGLPSALFPVNPIPALLFVEAFVLGTVLHEVLHGIGHVWGEASWNDVIFGMHWGALTPFASCQVPTRVQTYRVAVALPALVLGLLPLGAGLVTGYWLATFYGFLMLIAAAGDFLMLWILRVVPVDTWVQDHPKEVGYVIVAGHRSSPPSPVSEEELMEPRGTRERVFLREVAFLSAILLLCLVAGLLLATVLA